MTKEEKPIMLVLALVLSIAIFFGIRDNNQINTDKEKCNELKIKFGDKVRIKDGFYSGVEGTVVGKGNTAIDIQYLKGLELKTEGFQCGSVEVIK